MPTYPTYKLGDVAEIILGQSPESKSYNTQGEGLPFFQGKTEFTDWFPIPNKWCTEPKKIAEPFDVLLSVRAPVGPTNIAKEKCCIGRGLAAIRYADCYKYVLYYLRSVSKYLESKATGTTFSSISGDTIKNLPIPLPPLATQHAIVSRIETLFAELDKAVQHLRTAQQQLKTYRQAVLNHWLNNDEGKWEMVPIKEIINVISNGSTPKADKMFTKGEIQFLKVYNLNFDGSINLSKEPVFIERDTHETLLKRSQTKQGDVLINIVGPPLGKVSIVPEGEEEYNINQAIVMFRPNEFVISKFLAYYLMSPQIIEWLTSTSKATAGQYNVKVSTCREIMFPKVSIQEQHRIVQEIESRLSQATATETYIENALQQAEALRQSILKKAFSGELV